MWEGLSIDWPRLLYLEDPVAEDDDILWCQLMPRADCAVVGDDCLATSLERLEHLLSLDARLDGVIVKIDQCGSVTGALNFGKAARTAGLQVIVSQRSRETDSDFLAHLAVGAAASYLKAGCIARERIVKYNEFFRICEQLMQ
jgi:enolase